MPTRTSQFLAACLALLVWPGCSTKPGESTDGAGDDEWLVITSDSAEIDRHTQSAAKSANAEFEALFDGRGGESAWIDSETVRLIEPLRDEALARLNAMLTSGPPTVKSTDAALFLCRVEIDTGRAYLARVLTDGDSMQRARVLGQIDAGLLGYGEEDTRRYREFLLASPELVSGLLRQLDDADAGQVRAAIQCCGKLDLPGANGRFRAMLQRPDPPDRERLQYWLSQGPLTPELLDVVLAAPVATVDPNRPPNTTLLSAFARQDDPQLRQRARQELIRMLELWPDDGRNGFRGDRLDLIEALAETSGPEDLDWLRNTVEGERGYYGYGLLAQLVLLEGDAGRERLKLMLADASRRRDAVQVAGRAYDGTEDKQIVMALGDLVRSADSDLLLSIGNALVKIGGEPARIVAANAASRMEPAQGDRFWSRLMSPTIDQLDTAVGESGTLSAAALQRARAELQTETGQDGTQPPGLFEYFLSAKCGLAFDAETGELPCRHDRLIQDFAAASDGWFQPESVHQEWHAASDDDFEADYTLRFVHRGRLFAGRLRNFGDWYDVERVLAMVNAALEDAGLAQRFVMLDTGDQLACFLFAEPDKLRPLAERFHVPLGTDAAAAIRAGQEFEQRVLEKMELEEL